MESKESIKKLIISHLEGELKGSDLNRLLTWVESSAENAKFYVRVKDIWESSIPDASKIAETDKEWLRFLNSIKKDFTSNIFSFKTNTQIYYRFAAVLIIGLLLGTLLVNYIKKDTPVFISSVVPKGAVSQMILEDSSVVFLNADSELRYSSETNRNKREVYLEGEAWFNVISNKKKPFVVHTPFYDVNVTGTKFNVKSYETDSEIVTTLEEGEVLISSSEKYKLSENVTLEPGDQLVFNRNTNKATIQKVDTKIYTSWKDNKLMFLNMSFGDLIILLERKYGVEIEVEDQNILKYHYTGTLKNESILEVLEMIKQTNPIKYQIDDQKVRIYKN